MNKMISTNEPSLPLKVNARYLNTNVNQTNGRTHVVSVKTPITCGTFLDSSEPANPSRFAHGTMAR